MHIIFSHGKESGPDGGKIKQLRSAAEALGCSTESIDYRDLMATEATPEANIKDAEARVARLHKRLMALDEAVILVGSSMGGYVSWAAASQLLAQRYKHIKGLFLMVPAVYMQGYPVVVKPMKLPPMTIVHGWQDDVVPYQNSLRLAEEQQADYHLINDGHRLQNALPQVVQLFSAFLLKMKDK